MPTVLNVRFTPAQIDMVLAWRTVDYPSVIGPEAFVRLARAIIETLLGQRDVASMIELIADELDISDGQAQQLWDTMEQMTRRQIKLLDAETGPGAMFMYIGPVDKVTRPFCLQHVGRVYTRARIARLSNGQLPDVLLTGGGYNCRHLFESVAKSDRLMKELQRTGQRFFPVARRLRKRGIA